MSQAITSPTVLTLAEAAEYLRLSPERILREVGQGGLPGRQIDGEWRFLKATIDEWLSGSDRRGMLLSQAGALADDESLPTLLETIYNARQRPEVEEG
jgi:excisionase family DNA binding protein